MITPNNRRARSNHQGKVLASLVVESFALDHVWFCDPCQRGGDVFTLVQQHFNLSFLDALHWLAQRAGLTGSDDRWA